MPRGVMRRPRGGAIVRPRAGRTLASLCVAAAVGGFVSPAFGETRFASVYPENPVRTPERVRAPLAKDPIGPPDSIFVTLENELFRVASCVDRGALRSVSPESEPIRVCSPEQRARVDDAGEFSAPPRTAPPSVGEVDPFAEVSAYHHVSRTLAFVGARLGAGAPLLRGPIDVVVSARLASSPEAGPRGPFEPFVGSIYLPSDDGEGGAFRRAFATERSLLVFGSSGAINFAYDGDFVAHETAHAVLDSGHRLGGWRITEEGASHEPEALSEALADFVAAAQSGDGLVGDYVFSGATLGPARDLDAEPVTGAGLSGEQYAESLSVSGALWRARRAAEPGDVVAFDRAVLTTARGMRSDALSDEYFETLLEDLRTRGLVRPLATLERELANRSIVPRASRVVSRSEGETLRSTVGVFVAPGMRATRTTSIAPGMFQLRVAIPAGATHLRAVVDRLDVRRTVWGVARGSDASLLALVRWNRAIAWGSSGGGLDADVVRASIDDARGVAIAPGSREAFVQIANGGDEDGFFGGVAVTFSNPGLGDESPPDEDSCTVVSGPRPRAHGSRVSLASLALVMALRGVRRRVRHAARGAAG